MHHFKKLLVLFLLAFITLLTSCTNNKKEESNTKNFRKINLKIGGKRYEVSLSYAIKRQVDKRREWKELNFRKDFVIGGVNDTSLFGPIQVRTDKNGNIYVLDMAGHSVKKFDSNGRLMKSFGRAGRGPGEFQSPFRMDVLPNGKIIVLDPNLNKCEIFENREKHETILKYQPIGLCFINNTEFSTLQVLNPTSHSPIIRYNISSGKAMEYQNLLLTKSLDDVMVGALPFLIGDIFRTKNGGLIYVPMYMNHFVKFNKDGSIKYARNTVDEIIPPSYNRENFDLTDFRLPPEQISALASSCTDMNLYIISNLASIKDKLQHIFVIDIYSVENGDYLYSVKLSLSEPLVSFQITNDKIFLLKRNTELDVFNYKIEG